MRRIGMSQGGIATCGSAGASEKQRVEGGASSEQMNHFSPVNSACKMTHPAFPFAFSSAPK